MKVIVKAGDLARELGTVARVVSKKPVIPALVSVRMDYVLGRLRLAATDLELTARTSLGAAGEPGAALLPAQRLLDLVKTLPEDADVTIEASEAAAGGSMAARGFKAKLQGYPVEDYPALAEMPAGDQVMLPREGLVAAAARVRFATTDGDKRYFLDGAKLELRNGTMRLAATDGHRLAVADVPRTAGGDASTMVPRRALDLLAALAESGEGEVGFMQDDKKLYFAIGDRLLVASKTEGQFPNYERIIPPQIPGAQVDRPALQAALRRACMVTDVASRRVTLALSGLGLGISGRSADVGEAEEPVPATFSSAPVTTMANGSYLLDFVEAVDAPTLDLQVRDDASAIVWRSTEEGGVACQYVVMPMRG